MNVLHVTDVDLPGRRFNGYDLIRDLADRGIASKQAVLRKLSKDPNVVALASRPGDAELSYRLAEVERRHSINNVLLPWGRVLAATPEFRNADVVHYHLIHNRVISLYDLPRLFDAKPAVWTFHDPWPLTGHCIHPMGCEGWLNGCSPCPFLDRPFPLAEDRADQMWKLKRRLFAELDVDIVVASPWMLDLVRRSPVTSQSGRVHLIPFGVDVHRFLPDTMRADSRRRLGIDQDDFVVLVRAHSWEVKGLQYLAEALAMAPPTRPTTILTVDEPRRLDSLRDQYHVVDLGWLYDAGDYARAFAAADVFVMPSLAESFGLMAAEAMAAGRPVICFDGTAVPGTTHAPQCGIAVPQRDTHSLRAALDRLSSDASDARRRGLIGREIAEREYNYTSYLDSLTRLYESVVQRRSRARGV